MKITNPNHTPESVDMLYRQILQLLKYQTSTPSTLTRWSPKLSMAIQQECQEGVQILLADACGIDQKKITYVRMKDDITIEVHEFDFEAGFRVWEWGGHAFKLVSQTPTVTIGEF